MPAADRKQDDFNWKEMFTQSWSCLLYTQPREDTRYLISIIKPRFVISVPHGCRVIELLLQSHYDSSAYDYCQKRGNSIDHV